MARRTRFAVSNVLLALLILGVWSSTTPVGAIPTPGPGVPLWAPDWMAISSALPKYDPGLSRSTSQARAFDLIIAHSTEYDQYVPAMMGANPNLVLLVYVNGTYSPRSNYPEGWYAHAANGKRIKSLVFGTYLMYPRSPAWRDALRRMCIQDLGASGYQGCFLDSLGLTSITRTSVSAVPINRLTGAPYTRRAWLNDTEGLASSVRLAIAPTPVFGNGIGDGWAYSSTLGPTSVLLGGLSGGMVEAWVREATDPANAYRHVKVWRKDVDMLAAIGSRASGNIAIVVTKVWVKASAARVDAWQQFSLGTFLLGYVPGHAYFSFRANRALTQLPTVTGINLGAPTGKYFSNGKAFQRNFSLGTVVVNPGDGSASVGLGGVYLTAGGAQVTSVTLRAHKALILRSA